MPQKVLRSAPPVAAAGKWVPNGLAVLGAVILAASIAVAIGRNLDLPWTSIRLAPAFALAQGYSLYSMPDKPPWVMVGYGPLYPVAYLPSVFARHPISAVTLATLLAHFYILAPMGLLCSMLGSRANPETEGRPFPWVLGLLLFALVTHLAPSLTYVTAGVHADAPAFGLFLLACYAVLRAEAVNETGQMRWLLTAGVLAGLSATCKVNLAAGALALLIWITRVFGAKRAAPYLLASAIAGAVMYGGAIVHDGFDAVMLNLRQPAKMPWFTFSDVTILAPAGSSFEFADKVRAFLTFSRSYLQVYGPLVLAIAILARANGEAQRATRMAWLFLFLALFLTPASIASIAKYGGDVNSRALVSLPLTLAAICVLAAAVQRGSRSALVGTYAAVAAAALMVALPLKEGAQRIWVKTTLVESYLVISADPARWYFPYDPLAHLLGEGKFRPNIDVVYSYGASGFPVDASAFTTAMPENLRYIALPPSVAGWGGSEIRRLLPDYLKPAPEMKFEKHRVYAR